MGSKVPDDLEIKDAGNLQHLLTSDLIYPNSYKHNARSYQRFFGGKEEQWTELYIRT
jgi:hypothetical protein